MKKGVIFLLKKYKKYISPFFEQIGVKCKYYPTCSEYTCQAVERYGACRGLFLGIKRILRCNIFAKGGYDPLK